MHHCIAKQMLKDATNPQPFNNHKTDLGSVDFDSVHKKLINIICAHHLMDCPCCWCFQILQSHRLQLSQLQGSQRECKHTTHPLQNQVLLTSAQKVEFVTRRVRILSKCDFCQDTQTSSQVTQEARSSLIENFHFNQHLESTSIHQCESDSSFDNLLVLDPLLSAVSIAI